MAKKGLLLCVCEGTCPSFSKMNFFEVLNALRREKLIDYVTLHPQLCSDDGEEFLKTLLNNGDTERLYVAGCDAAMQKKLFRDAFEAVGYDREKHKGVDIRNMTTEQTIEAIKKLLQES